MQQSLSKTHRIRRCQQKSQRHGTQNQFDIRHRNLVPIAFRSPINENFHQIFLQQQQPLTCSLFNHVNFLNKNKAKKRNHMSSERSRQNTRIIEK